MGLHWHHIPVYKVIHCNSHDETAPKQKTFSFEFCLQIFLGQTQEDLREKTDQEGLEFPDLGLHRPLLYDLLGAKSKLWGQLEGQDHPQLTHMT